MEYGVILAGGAGTRLWPMSRSDRPKQLLPVVSGKSLLQLSYERLRGMLPPERIYVCTASGHAAAVRQNLPELPAGNLLGEPEGRDTANAIGFVCHTLHKKDADAVCAVVTADHVIEPLEQFHASLRTAFDVVDQYPDSLVTFGIIPTHGHTGLGYIHRGEALAVRGASRNAYRVLGFKEKPDRATADRYVDSGRYYWNSGMFVWRCSTFMSELQRYLPQSHLGLRRIAESTGTPTQQIVLEEVYPTLPKISVDFAVMEPASQGKGSAQVVVVEMTIQWVDVGSWPALSETLKMDDHDNAVDCPTCVMVDSDNNIIVSTDPTHLVSALGVSDMIVVHTPDVTMVCPKSEAQRVKELAQRVKERFADRFQ